MKTQNKVREPHPAIAWALNELRRRLKAQDLKEMRERDELMLYGDGKPSKFLPLVTSELQRSPIKPEAAK